MNENDFLDQVKKTLDRQAETLDGETLSRLNQARQSALQQTARNSGHSLTRTWIPMGGVAAAILLSSIFLFRAEEMAVVSDSTVDEIDIIASSDSLDLYEQLDFYMWLLEEDTDAV